MIPGLRKPVLSTENTTIDNMASSSYPAVVYASINFFTSPMEAAYMMKLL